VIPVSEHARSTGISAALFAVLVWAGWIPVTRLGVVGALHPADVTMLRYGTAGLLLLPFFWRHRREIPWQRPGWLVLIAAGAGAPYFLLFGAGLRLANSGQAAVFGPGASSVFTILLAGLWLRERINFARVLGIACTVGGFGWVAGHDLLNGGTRSVGFALILAASFAWSTFTIASRKLGMPPLLTASFIGVANAAVLLPLYLLSDGPTRMAAAPSADLLLQAAYQGLMTATLAMIAFNYAVRHLGAAGAAAFTPLVPVLAATIGWWLLGDAVDVPTAGGLAAVAIGVVIGSGMWRRVIAR
jgi:drug/metabolite transporter (DMT)-like permease